MTEKDTSGELVFDGKMALILAGYEDRMDVMMQSMNEGLRRRFQPKVVFPDFCAAEVAKILSAVLKRKRRLRLAPEAEAAAPALAARLAAFPEFANAGTAEQWATETYRAWAARHTDEELASLADLQIAADLIMEAMATVAGKRRPPPLDVSSITSVSDAFARLGLVGFADIQQKLRELQAAVMQAKQDSAPLPVKLGFLFVGKPGTGASTPPCARGPARAPAQPSPAHGSCLQKKKRAPGDSWLVERGSAPRVAAHRQNKRGTRHGRAFLLAEGAAAA